MNYIHILKMNNAIEKLVSAQWDLCYNLPQPPRMMTVSEIVHQLQLIDAGELSGHQIPEGNTRRYQRVLLEELIERWVNSDSLDDELNDFFEISSSKPTLSKKLLFPIFCKLPSLIILTLSKFCELF